MPDKDTSMLVFEIVTPGTWLDYEDKDWAWNIQGLLDSLKSTFFEANTALNLFIESRANCATVPDKEARERDVRRRSEISSEIEREYGGFPNPENWDQVHFESELRFCREKWSAGNIPGEFQHNLPFIYAKAFLYALDAFDKFLAVLAKEDGVSGKVEENRQKFLRIFSDLRGVRNTSQHLEDRSRGLGAGRNPQPMELQPVENGMVSAPGGGVLILNALNGNKYGSTMADGHYGEVEVSPESLRELQIILLEILQSFKWQGPKQLSPRT